MSRTVLVFLVVVGPWPVEFPWETSLNYSRSTINRLDQLPGRLAHEQLRVGVAEVDLAPATPVPLAGFIGQIVTPYEGVDSRCFAKALTLANESAVVTIVAADLLLINDKLAQAILRRTRLPRDQIYFTASHTHSGPGGWGNHPLERLVAGSFDPELFDRLVDRFAEAILVSRSRLTLVEVAFSQGKVANLQRNRIMPDQPTNDTLSAWMFRSAERGSNRKTLATFAVFGAHATISHPVPPRLGGDYPSAFAEALRGMMDSGVVLFAAGTVGDASPVRPPASTQRESVEAYGKILATRLTQMTKTAEFHSSVDFGVLGLSVDLPPVQVPFASPRLRFSPLFTWWIAKRQTYLHALKIGPAILLGFPGDISGHLGSALNGPVPVVATSFNGDYKGYLVTKETFRSYPCYETRWMSFFGPDLGEYLTDLSGRCIKKLLNSKL